MLSLHRGDELQEMLRVAHFESAALGDRPEGPGRGPRFGHDEGLSALLPELGLLEFTDLRESRQPDPFDLEFQRCASPQPPHQPVRLEQFVHRQSLWCRGTNRTRDARGLRTNGCPKGRPLDTAKADLSSTEACQTRLEFRRLGRAPALEVLDEIVPVLDAHRQPDEAVDDAERRAASPAARTRAS